MFTGHTQYTSFFENAWAKLLKAFQISHPSHSLIRARWRQQECFLIKSCSLICFTVLRESLVNGGEWEAELKLQLAKGNGTELKVVFYFLSSPTGEKHIEEPVGCTHSWWTSLRRPVKRFSVPLLMDSGYLYIWHMRVCFPNEEKKMLIIKFVHTFIVFSPLLKLLIPSHTV